MAPPNKSTVTPVTVPDECKPKAQCTTCACGTDCNTGTVLLSSTPLSTNHNGFSYAFYNQFQPNNGTSENPDFGMGTNVLVSNWAYVTEAGNDLVFIWGPSRAIWFDKTTLAARYAARQVLTHPAGKYRIFDPDSAMVFEFNDTNGLLERTITPGGQSFINSFDTIASQTRIIESKRTLAYTEGGVAKTTEEIWKFEYDSTTAQLTYATLLLTTGPTGAGTTAAIRRIAATYYVAGEAGGNTGNLKTVAQQVLDGTEWRTIETTYFRYYTENYVPNQPTTQPGYVNGLKFVVQPESFARLSRAADPFTAPDELVAQYADAYYEYTSVVSPANPRRVSKSVTGAGEHTHLFTYTSSSHADDYNHWKLKTVASHDDGSQTITFSNFVRQPILTDTWATPGTQANGRWIEHTVYDSTYARPIEDWTPASIDMNASGGPYTESVANLNVKKRGDANAGLVMLMSFYTSGDGTGWEKDSSVRQGSIAGTTTKVIEWVYTKSTVGADSLVWPSKETVFPTAGGTGIDTLFERDFFAAKLATEKFRTVFPRIPTTQNGQGDTNPTTDPQYIIEDYFDQQGRVIKHWDAFDKKTSGIRKTLTEFAYDEPTGARVRMIEDADPAATNPGPLKLTTDYKVDSLGRAIELLGPRFVDANGQSVRSATWTVYDDVNHEVRTGRGFAAAPDDGPQYDLTLVNPVSVTKMDGAGRTVDEISALRTDCSGTPAILGSLSAGDCFPQSSWVRWTHNEYDNGGDHVAVRVYHSIPTEGTGTAADNFDETRFGYDIMGRQNIVRSPGGTITRSVHDVRGLPTAIYIGTSDYGASDSYPDGGGAAGNNMIRTVTNYYDGATSGAPITVGGNGLLTRSIAHRDADVAHDGEVTHAYDFRNRVARTTAFIVPTGTVLSVITDNTYDNLDRVTQLDEYDTDTTLPATKLIGRSKTSYDNRGQIYLREEFGVAVPGGTVAPDPLKSNTWYDGEDRIIKSQPAGSDAYTKTKFDPIGRVTGRYTGYTTATDTGYLWTGADAPVGTNDKVFAQLDTSYDGASHAIETVSLSPHVGSTVTGKLTTANSRALFAGAWFDGAGRPLVSANYGTNDGTNPFAAGHPLTPPVRSDTVLNAAKLVLTPSQAAG